MIDMKPVSRDMPSTDLEAYFIRKEDSSRSEHIYDTITRAM